MIIKFFKSSYPLQYLTYLIIAIILWGGGFINPLSSNINTDEFLSPGYFFLINILGESPLLNVFIGFILVLFGGLLFNYILTKNDIVPKNILIPAFVFIVFFSHSANLLTLQPTLISSIFLLFVMSYIFQVYDQEEAYSQVFNAGFLIGLAAFFYFPSFFFLGYIWLTFIVFRIYSWREWLIVFIGFLATYIILWTYYFWVDSIESAFNAYVDYFSTIHFFQFQIEYSILNYFISSIIVILLLWSFFILANDLNEKIINVRKRYWSVLWFLVFAFISYLSSSNIFTSHQVFILIPAAVLVTYGFTKVRKTFWIELSFGILIVLIILNNFFSSFHY